VPAVDIGNASGVLLPALVACCINVARLVACTLEGWDLEVCNTVFLRRFVLSKNFFLGSGPISCSTLAAPACSFPSPRGGCRAVRAMHWRFFVGSYVSCIVVVAFPCSCGGLCSARFFCRFLIVKRGCCSCPIPCSALAEPACSCPSPRGGCRADPVMCWNLSFGFFVGCFNCRVVVVA